MNLLRALIAVVFIPVLSSCVFNRSFTQEQSLPVVKQAPSLSVSNDLLEDIAQQLYPPLKRLHIASKFGPRGKSFHEGVDMSGRRGDPVFAAHDGTVGISGERLSGYGEMIVLKFENFITVYGHLNEILVKKGQVVKQGDIIGTVGSTGDATGPHLHFEIRLKPKSANYYQSVDPEPFLRRIRFQ